MNCPECGEKLICDTSKVFAYHCPKCKDDYKTDYVMGYWKGYADAKYAAQQSLALDAAKSAANFPTLDKALNSNWFTLSTTRRK